ncbi:MAG: polymer-forming cytoskeletal protein [Oscillospiraceae bacterium]|nr:polymer-forming cytoskeletal protein [Oscillospiraceae bacterium]
MVSKKTGSHSATVIGRGVRLEAARLTGEEQIRIDGEYTGDVDSSVLVIGESGCVTGDIRARTVEVFGRVVGNICGGDVVHIKASAHVEGSIETRSLITEKGSWFNGNCQMAHTQVEEIPLLETGAADNFDNRVERFISTISG